jgi:hypothetical protein
MAGRQGSRAAGSSANMCRLVLLLNSALDFWFSYEEKGPHALRRRIRRTTKLRWRTISPRGGSACRLLGVRRALARGFSPGFGFGSLVRGERLLHIHDMAEVAAQRPDDPLPRALVENSGIRKQLALPLRKDGRLLDSRASAALSQWRM